MDVKITIPDLNMNENEVRLLLAIKLLEDNFVSLGKAAEIARYSEKAFPEVLIKKDVSPIKYTALDHVV